MTAPTYTETPLAEAAVLAELRGFAQLVDRHGGDPDRIDHTRPIDLTAPWLLVRGTTPLALAARRGAWSSVVQLDSCATGPVRVVGDDTALFETPEEFTGRVALLIAAHLDSLRAQVFTGPRPPGADPADPAPSMSWRPRYLDGPLELIDRPTDELPVIYRRVLRVDVRCHAHL